MMIYLFIQVTPPYGSLREFNEYWGKESLPFWIKHGARHIGSYQNFIGGPVNEVIRLFEFDDLTHYQHFQQALTQSEEGKDLLHRLSRFKYTLTQRFLSSIYPDAVKVEAPAPTLYALYSVIPVTEKAREFNEVWGRASLPFHLKHGVRHVGSFRNNIGGSSDEVIRLFGFDDYAHHQRFQRALVESEEGRELMHQLEPYLVTLTQRFLRPIH